MPEKRKVIRSDVRKLTACREVRGLYKPPHAKSRLNGVTKAHAAEPLLALGAWLRDAIFQRVKARIGHRF